MNNTGTFHNTIGAKSEELEHLKLKAGSQARLIANFFRTHPMERFTPFQVMYAVFPGGNTPVTSVRRAINDLTRRDLLRMTGRKEPGKYGVTNNTWQWQDPTERQRSLLL